MAQDTRSNLILMAVATLIAVVASLAAAGIRYGSLEARVERSERDIQTLQQELRDELRAMRNDVREVDRKVTHLQALAEGKR